MRLEHDEIDIAFATPDRAEEFVRMQQQLAQESNFMLLTHAETLEIDIETQRRSLEDFAKEESLRKVIFAFHGDQLIGYLGYGYAGIEKARHVVRDIAVGVLQNFRRNGVARKLFAHAEKQWILAGKKVARLSVMDHNEKAFGLYKKLGFQIEGIENMSVCEDGAYVNQKLMWKRLDAR